MTNTNNTKTNVGNAGTGTNLYVNLLLLVGSIFGGMSTDTATLITGAGMGVAGAFFAFRNWLVTARFTLDKSWVKDPNNWAYVSAALVALVPVAAPLVDPLKDLANALVAGNWGAIITGAVTLVSLVYYTFFKPRATKVGE